MSDPGLEESGFQIDWTCDLATAAPTVDFLVDADTTCTGIVNFQDLSSNGPSSWSWDFGDGNISSTQNPSHTYTQPGFYTVQLTATNAIGSDTEIKTNLIYVNMPDVPVVQGDSICTNNVANLSATGTGTLKWYNSPVSSTVINTGTNYTTPVLTSSTTYYVEDFIPAQLQKLGKVDNSGGGGYLSTEHYLVFDAYEQMFIQSVTVYAQTTGSRTIQLQDNNGVVLNTRTSNITAGTKVVVLAFLVNPGTDYRLVLLDASTVKDLYRNNAGVSYPYTLSGIGSVKNSSAGSSYYYYFYDWDVKGSNCTSPREPVDAIVSLCTGVDAITNQNSWSAFYNNTNGNLELSINGLSKGDYSITIFNSLGQSILKDKLTVSNDSSKEKINLSNSSHGVYFIQLSNGITTFTEKFIK